MFRAEAGVTVSCLHIWTVSECVRASVYSKLYSQSYACWLLMAVVQGFLMSPTPEPLFCVDCCARLQQSVGWYCLLLPSISDHRSLFRSPAEEDASSVAQILLMFFPQKINLLCNSILPTFYGLKYSTAPRPYLRFESIDVEYLGGGGALAIHKMLKL
jgi:hypothetical protein